MSLLALLCLFSVLINLEVNSSGVCKIVTVKNSILKNDKCLNGFQFKRSTTVPDIIQCARNCFFRRRCLSFNYKENPSVCELNNARVDPPEAVLNTSSGYIYSDIEEWDKAIGIGPCWNQPCGICEACYPTEFNYTCVKEELTSCQDIKICTNASSDGHYLIRPVMGTKPWLKVYCNNMTSKYPKDYLTLIEKNFVSRPPSSQTACLQFDWTRNVYTTFQKIRLDVTMLRVIKSDLRFSISKCDDPKLFEIPNPQPFKKPIDCSYRVDYGVAEDCAPSMCQPNGKFVVDLRGTGLKVAQSVKWIKDGNPSLVQIDFLDEDQTVKGICGGDCGGCKPERNFLLEPKP